MLTGNYSYDCIVIGSGCAGYDCADWLYDLGVRNIALITEGRFKGTSRNTGSDKQTYYKMSLAGDEGDSVYKMARTLFDGGAMDGDVAIAEAANSVRCFMKLANLGVDFPTNQYGEYVGYKTDHDPYCRATSIGPYTSKKMTEVLERSVISKGIEIINDFQVVKILTKKTSKGSECLGLIAVKTVPGAEAEPEFISVKAPCVILATGGPAAIYFDSVYPQSHTGSTGLAYDAGATLTNLAEWQYGLASVDFRWNVSGTYQQVLPRYISIDEKGIEREFLLDYYPTPAEAIKNIFLKGYEWPFDVRKIKGSSYIDLLVYHQSVILGRKVYMDFTREPTGLEEGFEILDPVSKEYLMKSDALIPGPINRLKVMNPGAISLYKDHNIDITKEPLRIAVCAQHNNGGVRVDSDWKTCVEGLYAIGEVAGTLGISRPGGSALNSCQVGALRAAEHIAFKSKRLNLDSQKADDLNRDYNDSLNEAMEEIMSFLNQTHRDTSNIDQKRAVYQKFMSRNFAFLRNVNKMKESMGELYSNLEDFNKENFWTEPWEAAALFKNKDICTVQLAVAESMLKTALEYGSRGSCYVLENDDFLGSTPLPEDTQGRYNIITVDKQDDSLKPKVNIIPVRPLPDRNLWFEKVWNEYNEQRGI